MNPIKEREDNERSSQGLFIAIDGIDGAGKTTLANELAALLAPLEPEVTKEPTADSPWGMRLRASAEAGRLPPEEEVEYFHKDRLHHIESFIVPHLQLGAIVICDRYVDSTLAFQAKSVADADRMQEAFYNEIIVPDVTFILTCPVEVGLRRIAKNRSQQSVFETEETLSHAKMIYESRKGGHYAFIDASGSPAKTLDQAVAVLKQRFPQLKTMLEEHYPRLFGAR